MSALSLALGAVLVGCSSSGGGGGDDACADADDDGVCDVDDLCPGTPAGCAVDAVGCPLAPCGGGDCSADFLGGQVDGTACFRDASIPNACAGPFRLLLSFADDGSGGIDVTISSQDNPGGGSNTDAAITGATCAADCSGDATTFTCDVMDAMGNVRTIVGTIDAGGDVEGTIETSCGDVVAFDADGRPDGDCAP